jgi:hypothetical protein
MCSSNRTPTTTATMHAEKTATKAKLANIVQTNVDIILSCFSGPRPAEHH